MVAVNPRFTLLAFSLASLSLAPPAAAAAIDTRSSDPGSPSKLARQLPMPMKLAARDTGKHRKQREDDAMSKGSKFHKSRVAGETILKRQQEQAHFDIDRVTRRNVEARQDPCTPGYVDITSPTGNSTDGPTNSTTIGHLFLNSTRTPWVLDASQNNMTNLCLARSGSDNNSFMLQMPIDGATQNTTTTYCATYNPNPPAPEPLTMEECDNPATPGASQAFLYNNATREIQPMWYTTPVNGTTSNGTASTASAETVNDEEVNDSDDSSSLRSRDTAKDVTLVFVPSAVTASDVGTEEVSPSSESGTATMTATVTTTVTATATPSFAAADVDTASSTSDSPSQSTSTTSSDGSSATPSFAAADFNAASSTTDVPSQAPPSPSDSSLVSPTSSDDSTATASLVAAGVDAPSSQTDAPSPTDSSLVSATSSDDSTATPSFVPADVDASSTTDVQPTPTSSDSSASTVAALDVEVASASTSTDSGSASTDTVAPTVATSSSSDSSVPSATASTVDAAAIANSSASSAASSSSAAPSPSSSADAVVTPASDEQAVYVGNAPAARAQMTPVNIADPYQLKFSAEPRL